MCPLGDIWKYHFYSRSYPLVSLLYSRQARFQIMAGVAFKTLKKKMETYLHFERMLVLVLSFCFGKVSNNRRKYEWLFI